MADPARADAPGTLPREQTRQRKNGSVHDRRVDPEEAHRAEAAEQRPSPRVQLASVLVPGPNGPAHEEAARGVRGAQETEEKLDQRLGGDPLPLRALLHLGRRLLRARGAGAAQREGRALLFDGDPVHGRVRRHFRRGPGGAGGVHAGRPPRGAGPLLRLDRGHPRGAQPAGAGGDEGPGGRAALRARVQDPRRGGQEHHQRPRLP
mmetsp:Transcript_16568/g.38363  ORF Transcript_16568/g.38363 Transcript_16568/m.38363 type:complete len:206 (+) Transcript_16568:178-795(+)